MPGTFKLRDLADRQVLDRDRLLRQRVDIARRHDPHFVDLPVS